MEFSQELAIKAVSAISGAVSLFFTLRNQVRQRRQALKVDLEIIDSIKDQALKTLVTREVYTRIKQLYGLPGVAPTKKRIHHMPMFIFGIVILAVFAYWTVYLNVGKGFNWWSLLTGFVAFAGLGNIMGSLQVPEKGKQATSNTN